MQDTWASGALELLRHADSHIELDSAFDKRIAFISIDNCVETAIRTFLSLPSSKSGVHISRKEIDDAGNSFPKFVSLLFKHAPDKVLGLDDGYIEHYHRIRYHLYHEGTGLSVDERYLNAYRQIAGVLLNNLFGIAIKSETDRRPSLERLILLWNEIESKLRDRLTSAGINFRHTFKWEEAVQAGILDMQTIQDITELRMIRNKQVHSTPDEIDRERISFGVSLAEKVMKRLRG
jgi:hypothetical protein